MHLLYCLSDLSSPTLLLNIKPFQLLLIKIKTLFMRIKSICLFVIICTLASNTKAQNCDPWITKIYKQFYGRTPNAVECNIRNYNNGSWNSFDQLSGFIRTYQGGRVTPLTKESVLGNCGQSNYKGICQIAEFTNVDFPIQRTTCGQAAAVTALWHAGLNAKYGTPESLVKNFFDYAPPKITIGGLIEKKDSLGTDWRQMEYGMNKYASLGMRYNWQKGKAALQNELRKGNPCLIMIDMGTLPPYSWLSGGHWVVAYGYDNSGVHVTNLGNLDNKMTWDQLHKAWGGSLTEGHLARLHGKTEEFMTVWKD